MFEVHQLTSEVEFWRLSQILDSPVLTARRQHKPVTPDIPPIQSHHQVTVQLRVEQIRDRPQ